METKQTLIYGKNTKYRWLIDAKIQSKVKRILFIVSLFVFSSLVNEEPETK